MREAVVNRDVFVFEHFFYSSAKLILITTVLGVKTVLLRMHLPVHNFLCLLPELPINKSMQSQLSYIALYGSSVGPEYAKLITDI